MEKIICIGSSSKDIFFPTGEGAILETPEDLMSQKKIAFELGAKYKIVERFESIGGCAANVASGLARLGIETFCCSRIGDDDLGRWIRAEMKNNGVKDDFVQTEPDCRSDLSAIIVDSNSGERTIFSNQKANGKLVIQKENFDGFPMIFIGDLHGNWENILDEIISIAKEKKIKIAYNPRQSNIHDNARKIVSILGDIEVLFLNKDEAIEIISGSDDAVDKKQLEDERSLLEKIRLFGSKIVAMTDGKKGAWVFDGGNFFEARATGQKPVDTTGAGDAFASGFLGAHIKNKGIEESLKWGISNSGNSVAFYGAVEGLMSEEEISIKSQKLEIIK